MPKPNYLVFLAGLLLSGCPAGEAPDSPPPADEASNTAAAPSPAAALTAPALTLEPRPGAITVRWAGVSGAAGYRLYWRDAYTAASVEEMALQLGFDHSGLQPGQTYYYRVAALDLGGAEYLSGEVGATVPAAAGPARNDAGP